MIYKGEGDETDKEHLKKYLKIIDVKMDPSGDHLFI